MRRQPRSRRLRCWPGTCARAAIAGYAGRLGQDALKVFGARWSDRHGGHIPPSESSFRRLLGGPRPGALARAAGTWLADQADAGALDARRARRLTARLTQDARAVR